jgi:hypothetical protein
MTATTEATTVPAMSSTVETSTIMTVPAIVTVSWIAVKSALGPISVIGVAVIIGVARTVSGESHRGTIRVGVCNTALNENCNTNYDEYSIHFGLP